MLRTIIAHTHVWTNNASNSQVTPSLNVSTVVVVMREQNTESSFNLLNNQRTKSLPMENNSNKILIPRIKNSNKRNFNSPTSSMTSLRNKLSKVLVAILFASTTALILTMVHSRNSLNALLNVIAKGEWSSSLKVIMILREFHSTQKMRPPCNTSRRTSSNE